MTDYEDLYNLYGEKWFTIQRLLKNRYLEGFLGKDASVLWKFIDGLFRKKLTQKPIKKDAFKEFIPFSRDYVQEHTGLSKLRQKKALEILQSVGIVEVAYQIRGSTTYRVLFYRFDHIEDFGFDLYQHIAYLSAPYRHKELLKGITPSNNPFFVDEEEEV